MTIWLQCIDLDELGHPCLQLFNFSTTDNYCAGCFNLINWEHGEAEATAAIPYKSAFQECLTLNRADKPCTAPVCSMSFTLDVPAATTTSLSSLTTESTLRSTSTVAHVVAVSTKAAFSVGLIVGVVVAALVVVLAGIIVSVVVVRCRRHAQVTPVPESRSASTSAENADVRKRVSVYGSVAATDEYISVGAPAQMFVDGDDYHAPPSTQHNQSMLLARDSMVSVDYGAPPNASVASDYVKPTQPVTVYGEDDATVRARACAGVRGVRDDAACAGVRRAASNADLRVTAADADVRRAATHRCLVRRWTGGCCCGTVRRRAAVRTLGRAVAGDCCRASHRH
jgi:hypothetical protein